MTKVTFKLADGGEAIVDATDNDSVMDVARTNGIDAIAAECGGEMMCATCHVYVDQAWVEAVGGASEDELEMLEFAASEVNATSRLSCQIKINDQMDGLILHLPETQI